MSRPLPSEQFQGVLRDQLGLLGRELGRTGLARLYDLPGLRLRDVDGALVYKEYRPGYAPTHALRGLVGIRRALNPARCTQIEASIAWPVRYVLDNGFICGYVHRRISEGFRHVMMLPSGSTEERPCEIQMLFIAPDRLVRCGIPVPTPDQRRALCCDLARTFELLHDELDVVMGGITARSILYRLSPEPATMIVDCDEAGPAGSIALIRQLVDPDWAPSDGILRFGKSEDLYQLGLFVLRTLTPGSFCSVDRNVSRARHVLDATGMELLTATLDGPPDQRPAAREWVNYYLGCRGEVAVPKRGPAEQVVLHAASPVSFDGVGEVPLKRPVEHGPGVVARCPVRDGSAVVRF